MLPTTSQHSNGSLGSRDAARHTAGAKRYKYLRRLLHFRQMDFEFALWQMLYLFTSPQRVYRNFHYRKQTKDQWARDDPAFLVLLSIWLCVSTIGFGLVLDMGVLETLKLLLWVVFVDCIGVGLLISTLMWVISNKYLLKHPSREFDVEWGYAFDVHLNAFYPLLVILHFLQLFFINHVIVIKSDWFLGYFVGNTLWLIAIGYYLYITFLGYNGVLPDPAGMGSAPEDEDGEQGDMAFLKDLLSPSPGVTDDFSREWQDAFGLFDAPTAAAATTEPAPPAGHAAPLPQCASPSPTGFLPSQLLDHSLSSAGWSTPPMFQAPPLQPPRTQNQSAPPAPTFGANATAGGSRNMSAWFNLFADLDPLSNPDAIGRSADELLNA